MSINEKVIANIILNAISGVLNVKAGYHRNRKIPAAFKV